MNPSNILPTQGRIVHVKYLTTAGIAASLGTVPGIIVKTSGTAPDCAPLLTVTAFGDNAPVPGSYLIGSPVPLYGPTNPETGAAPDKVTVPAAAPVMRGGALDGKPVWCEWPPAPTPNPPAAKPAS